MKKLFLVFAVLSLTLVLFVPSVSAVDTNLAASDVTLQIAPNETTIEDGTVIFSEGWSQTGSTAGALKVCDGINKSYYTTQTGATVEYNVSSLKLEDGKYKVYFYKNYRAPEDGVIVDDTNVKMEIIDKNGNTYDLRATWQEAGNTAAGRGWQYVGIFDFSGTAGEKIKFTRLNTARSIATRAGGIGFIKVEDETVVAPKEYPENNTSAVVFDAYDDATTAVNLADTNKWTATHNTYLTPKGNNHYYTKNVGNAFRFDIPFGALSSGTYKVYYWRISHTAAYNSRRVKMNISHNGQEDIRTVSFHGEQTNATNGYTNKGTWQLVDGYYYFTGLGNEYLMFTKTFDNEALEYDPTSTDNTQDTLRIGGVAFVKVSENDITVSDEDGVDTPVCTAKKPYSDRAYTEYHIESIANVTEANLNNEYWLIVGQYGAGSELLSAKLVEIAGPETAGNFVISSDFSISDINDEAAEIKVMLWNATDGKLTPLSQTVPIPLSE